MKNYAVIDAQRRRAHTQVTLRRRLMPVLLAGCFGTALANPFGPQVVNGQASFLTQGNVLSVTNTPGAIINWQSFSINPGELTRFIQQNPDSAVLNRITGQDPSKILGALQSNGRVFLVNPNGILFGQGAQVDVNGLVASTLNISNEDFLNGKLLFKAGEKAGNLKNEGTIATPAGGQIVLIAPNVGNSGLITSPKGEVMLAAGHTVQLVDTQNPDLRVVLSAPEHEALNLGQVITQGGHAGMYGALVRQRGMISADSAVVGENGKVVFKASRDVLLEAGSRTTARGAGKGGEVQVLGERVGLTGDAKVDASGQLGGGTVLVGGDYQGRNAAIQNAKRTYVGKDAEIKADAVDQGDGGKVIVWSDESTRYYGNIVARGGRQSGDGGLVETSGKQNLAFNGKVDVSATNGQAGSLLLDPQDIIIANGSGGADDGMVTGDGSIFAGEPDTSTDVTISEQALEALSGNVTLNASRDVILQNIADGSVNLANVGSGSTFSINAGRDILGTADVNDRFETGGGHISFSTTDGDINIGGVKSKGGNVTMNAGGTGFMVIREVNTTPGGGSGGNVSLTSAGFLTLNTINASGTGINPRGNVTLNAGGDISVANTATITANNLSMTAAGGIHGTGSSDPVKTQVNSLNAKTTGVGDIRISNSGNLAIYDGGTPGNNGIDAADGVISIVGDNQIDVEAPIVAHGAQITLSGPLNIHLDSYNSGTNIGGLIASNGGNISLTVTGGGMIDIASGAKISSVGGLITLTSDRADMAGSLIDAGSGNVQLMPYDSNQHIQIGGSVSDDTDLAYSQADLAAIKTSGTLKIGYVFASPPPSGNVTVSEALDLTSPGNLTGPLEIYTSSGTVTIDRELTVPNDLYITSGSGSIVTTDTPAALPPYSGSITAGSANSVVLKAAAVNLGSSVSADEVEISTNSLTLGANASITSSVTGIYPKTAGNTITVGAACGAGCLSITDLYKINSPVIGIGNTSSPIPGDITVAGITASLAGNLITDRHVNTTRIGLMTGGNVTQTGAIDVHTLGVKAAGSVNLATSNNHVVELAGLSGGAFAFKNDQSFSIEDITGSGPTYDYSLSGLVTSDSDITLTLNGDSSAQMDLDAAVNAGTGTVTLESTGSVYGSSFSPDIVAGNVSVKADGPAGIDGGGGLHITAPLISKLEAATGSIDVLGFSALKIGALTPTAMTAVSAPAGSVTIATSGSLPLTINGDVSAHGNVDLIAGSAGSSSSGNVLTINRPVTSTSGTITLGANSVTGTDVPTGPNVSLQLPGSGSSSPPPAPPPPPTVSECVANPSLPGCSAVLPTLEACTAAPSTPGCSAVLPTVDACVANPTQSGCSAVLPTLSVCTSAPTTPGCNVVLPSLSTCTSAPTTPGCTAVLPPISVCTAAPATEGCSVVLPTLSSCTTNPSQAGCSVVLPPLNTCISAPATPGCTAVLPTVTACTSNPAQAGCTVVLPTLSSCTSNPTQAGCTVVLPSMSTCTTAPTTAGCTAVLPTLAQCSANPAQEGCSVVVPTAGKCVTNPSLPECQVVLPPTDTGSSQTPTSAINEAASGNTSTVVKSMAQASPNPAQGGGGTSGGSGKQSEGDGKKDDKKTTSSTDDSGAKNEKPATKMYCN